MNTRETRLADLRIDNDLKQKDSVDKKWIVFIL